MKEENVKKCYHKEETTKEVDKKIKDTEDPEGKSDLMKDTEQPESKYDLMKDTEQPESNSDLMKDTEQSESNPDLQEDTKQPGSDLVLLDDPRIRKEYLDCMRELLIQITDFGMQQEALLGRSIISHTKYRLKSRDSIVAKMIKKKRELTEENVFTYINDLAGIRVVCLFLDDIYRVRDFIYQIPDLTILKEKDFVKKPKNSGYQSLHVIVQFTNGRKVEIQLRLF